jgi:hypothetical protein
MEQIRTVNMGKTLKYFTLWIGVLFLTAGFSRADSRPPRVGGVLPQFSLSAPASGEHQQYLGITGKESFTIPEIRAEIVIIEIFNMY